MSKHIDEIDLTPNPKINKTKYLEEHFGGKWKYDGTTSWWCNDDKRHVSRTASCTCDDACNCPCRYFLYGEDAVKEIKWLAAGENDDN